MTQMYSLTGFWRGKPLRVTGCRRTQGVVGGCPCAGLINPTLSKRNVMTYILTRSSKPEDGETTRLSGGDTVLTDVGEMESAS